MTLAAWALALSVGALFGATSGAFWTLYVKSVAEHNRIMAAVWDGAIIVPALATTQVWAWLGATPVIFVGYLIGSVIATYFVTPDGSKES